MYKNKAGKGNTLSGVFAFHQKKAGYMSPMSIFALSRARVRTSPKTRYTTAWIASWYNLGATSYISAPICSMESHAGTANVLGSMYDIETIHRGIR